MLQLTRTSSRSSGTMLQPPQGYTGGSSSVRVPVTVLQPLQLAAPLRPQQLRERVTAAAAYSSTRGVRGEAGSTCSRQQQLVSAPITPSPRAQHSSTITPQQQLVSAPITPSPRAQHPAPPPPQQQMETAPITLEHEVEQQRRIHRWVGFSGVRGGSWVRGRGCSPSLRQSSDTIFYGQLQPVTASPWLPTRCP